MRDTSFDGHEIHEGDIMGLIDNKINCVGSDVAQVAKDVLAEMVSDESELITVFYGQDMPAADAEALSADISDAYPGCDTTLYAGGQPLYYYIISVE